MDQDYANLVAWDEMARADEVIAPLSEEEQEEIIKKLKYEYDCFISDVASLHDNIKRYHKVYAAERQAKKEFPWPGASNYTVPLAQSMVDSVHARIMKAVFEPDPLWLAKPRVSDSVEVAKKAEWYLDTWADTMNLVRDIDSVTMNMLIDGVGILKVDWIRTVRRIPKATGQDGQPLQNTVTDYEGPRGYPVPLLDFVMIPADAPTIDDAVYVGHRVFLTQQQLEERRRIGLYFNVGKLIEKGADSKHGKTTAPTNIVNIGNKSSNTYPETKQYEIIELYGPHVFDPEIGPQPALFTFSAEHSILLRIEPYPYQYGRAPYIDFQIFPRPNFFWGRSMVEMLESPQEELTALHNMRADSLARSIAPPLLRRLGSRWNPEEQPWQPGMVIDTNDPAEIIELSLSPVPHAAFVHSQEILENTERMTGMSDVFMGRVGSPYASATATNAARSEGLVRMDVSISRFQESMKRLAWVLWWMLYQYRPYLDTFSAANTNYTINKLEMAPSQNGLMPYEFIPQGMQSDVTKENRRQQLIFLLNTAANGLSQFYPDGLQKLLMEVFDAFDIKNKELILGPPWSTIQQMIQQAFQQGMMEGAKSAERS